MNSIDIPEEHQNVNDNHDTFVERFLEDVIDWRRHQVKGMMTRKVIRTTGMTQTCSYNFGIHPFLIDMSMDCR